MEVGDPVTVGGDHHGLVLAELDGIAGVFDECRHIGADEHLAVADTEHQRCRAAGGDDRARFVGVGEHQREVTLQPGQHGEHRPREIACGVAAVVLPGDQVHGDLGVGVAGELHTVGFQLLAQLGVVLDDAVVDHRDLARGVTVRVRIAVGRPAMGGPPGVAQPGTSSETRRIGRLQRRLQIDQPPRTAPDGQPAAPLTSATPAES